MRDRDYAKCKLLGTDNSYIYIEVNHKKCSSYGKYVDEVGKDLITGTRVVSYVHCNDIEDAILRDPVRSGNLHLYVDFGRYLHKSEVITALNKMSKEDIEKYVKSIKDVKEKYKKIKKEIRQKNKEAVIKYRKENKELNSAKRKVKMIKKTNIG